MHSVLHPQNQKARPGSSPSTERQGQDHQEFKANLDYVTRPHLKQNKPNKKQFFKKSKLEFHHQTQDHVECSLTLLSISFVVLHLALQSILSQFVFL